MTDQLYGVGEAVVKRYPLPREWWNGMRAYRVVKPGIIDDTHWDEGCIVWLKDDQVEALEDTDDTSD